MGSITCGIRTTQERHRSAKRQAACLAHPSILHRRTGGQETAGPPCGCAFQGWDGRFPDSASVSFECKKAALSTQEHVRRGCPAARIGASVVCRHCMGNSSLCGSWKSSLSWGREPRAPQGTAPHAPKRGSLFSATLLNDWAILGQLCSACHGPREVHLGNGSA